MKQVKPLPAPLDGQRKKRGGRRWAGQAGGWAGRGRASPQLTPGPHPQVPQDEGAAGADGDPEAGQPHELRRGRSPAWAPLASGSLLPRGTRGAPGTNPPPQGAPSLLLTPSVS